uniref:Uncharacterized protein n=1 Tax=Globisporangium ultimum (strain ATCC 200006 / CBS 805.95 / DAOM BR144) TaxID=431595 RepID=K3WWX5_GLOUD
MASFLLDELPCLLDEANELMARLAFSMKQVNTAGDAPSSPFTDARLKFFHKQFLTAQPVTLDKMLAQLPSAPDARTTLQSTTKSVFHLMKRVHHWQRAAWGAVTQFFAEANNLTFDTHRVLTQLLLNTVVKYVKVHLLWTSWHTAIPSLLAVHTFCQHYGSSTSAPVDQSSAATTDLTMYSPLDHMDHHLREYVLCFGTTPLAKIQQDFRQHPDAGEIARNLTALTLSCFECYLGCHDLEQLRNQGTFDLETFFSGDNYADRSVYDDLLLSHEQTEWVLCVALCLPQQLRASVTMARHPGSSGGAVQLWDFVRVVAQDQLVMAVFRDTLVNVHTLLYQQIALTFGSGTPGSSNTSLSSPTSPSSSSSLGQPSLKKMMSTVSKHALRSCAVHHSQRRQFYVWLLTSSVHLLTQNGALVAPLFPMLLAALAGARTEIEWAFVHCGSHLASSQPILLPSHVKAKHLQRAQSSFTNPGAAQSCGELLALSHQLRSLAHQHLHFVKSYYREFLVNGNADAIAYEIDALLSAEANSSGGIVNASVRDILRGFASKNRYSLEEASGVDAPPLPAAWRREWRQLSVILLIRKPALPKPFLRLMERACRHSKYVESPGDVLEQQASCSKWWWFVNHFETLFHHLLVAPGGSGPEVIAVLETVEAAIAGTYALDEIVDDSEAQHAADAMAALYQRMRDVIGTQLEVMIDKVVAQEVASHVFATGLHQIDARGDQRILNLSKKSGNAKQDAQLTSSSSSFKASETRLAASLSGRVVSTVKQGKRAIDRAAEETDALSTDEAALYSLVGAMYTQMAKACPQRSSLANLVERHVRLGLERFLRGLVVCSNSNSSNNPTTTTGSALASASASSMTSNLRCSLQDACVALESYMSCVQRLFRNAPFIDLARVVLDTLATESRAHGNDDDESTVARPSCSLGTLRLEEMSKWTLLERLQWFYSSMLEHLCAPRAASGAPTIASPPRQYFSASTQEHSKPTFADTNGFNLEAAQCLHTIIGISGIKALSQFIVDGACSKVKALGAMLEQDRIALIRFEKSIDAPYAELLMAVKQMARLEDVVAYMTQIGLALFFASLLERVHPSCSVSENAQWQHLLATERTPDASGGGSEGNASARRPWDLLPIAFAASFHAPVWRRTSHVAALDATDTNAHMSCTAMLHLLPLVQTHTAALGESPLPSTPDSSGVERDLLRDVMRRSSRVVLGMRRAAKEPTLSSSPSSAMLAALRMFAVDASTFGGHVALGILDECLPEIVRQTASFG